MENINCAMCGTALSPFVRNYVVGTTGNRICGKCIRLSAMLASFDDDESKAEGTEASAVKTPRQMVDQLDKTIIGQAKAKTAIAAALWKQQLKAAGEARLPVGALLLYGPTGCGKTALVKAASKLANLPFMSFDATQFSESGYKGMDAQDMVTRLFAAYPEHPNTEYGVIFLDEVDKLSARGGEERTASYRGTQHNMLKLIEGCEISLDSKHRVNTGNLLFILGGAFAGLDNIIEHRCRPAKTIGFNSAAVSENVSPEASSEDFISYGMEQELMGRITQRVRLSKLSAEELRRIILDSESSVYRSYREFFASRGIDLRISRAKLSRWISDAQAMNSGARGLQSVVEDAVEPLIIRLAEHSRGEEETWYQPVKEQHFSGNEKCCSLTG